MRFEDRMLIQLPAELHSAVKQAALKALTTKSEYVRRALMEKLEREKHGLPSLPA